VERAIEWPATRDFRPLNIDAKAVVCVLRELTLLAWQRAAGTPLKVAIHPSGDSVAVELTEPAHDLPMQGDLIEESARLVQSNGGTLEHVQNPATQEWLTMLTFSVGASASDSD